MNKLIALIKEHAPEFIVDDRDQQTDKLKTYLVGDLLVILEGIDVKIVWRTDATISPTRGAQSTLTTSMDIETITQTVYVSETPQLTVPYMSGTSTVYVVYGR